jgi:hypothetical protein
MTLSTLMLGESFEKNPNPRFLQNHHQWQKQFGRDKVHDQIELCTNMDDFKICSRFEAAN